MTEHAKVLFVVGPDGERMTRQDLPAPDNHRWVPRRKAKIVAAVEGGMISMEEALETYRITREEYESWQRDFSRHGLKGLRVTRLRETRMASE